MSEHGEVRTRLPGPWNRAPETEKLITLLSETDHDILTDEELERMIGKSCRVGGKAYPQLLSAIRYVRRHHRRVWKREPKTGCIRLADTGQCFKIAESCNKSIRRIGRVGMGTMAAIHREKLSEAECRAMHANVAAFGSIVMFSEKTTRKALEARNAREKPAPAALLSLWSENGKNTEDADLNES